MEKNELINTFASRLEDLHAIVTQTNKMPVLIISQYPLDMMTGCRLPNIRESISNIICFVEIGDPSVVEHLLHMSDGYVDRIILDIDNKRTNSQEIINAVKNTKTSLPILNYSDLDVWGNTSVDYIEYIEKGIYNKNILVCGKSFLTSRIILKLLSRGANVYINDIDNSYLQFDNTTSITIQNPKLHFNKLEDNIYDIIVGTSIFTTSITSPSHKAQSVYDIGLNNFTEEYIYRMQNCGSNVYRYDNRAGISSVLLNLLENEYLVKHNMGKVKIGDIEVISGGIMGPNGAIVVDNAYNPQFVVGVANGTGIVKSTKDLTKKNIEDIEIINQLIAYGK